MKGRQTTPWADMDAGGASGDKGEEAFRRGQMGILRQAMMLDGPDAIETHLFGEHAFVDHVLEDLGLILARGVHHLRFINDRKFHLPFPLMLLPEPEFHIARN